MSVFEIWSKAIEDRDAEALIDCLHDDFEFVRHQTETSMNKFEMANMLRTMLSNKNVVSSGHRCLYENDEIFVMHSIVSFSDETAESVLQFNLLFDGKIIKTETGATPILNSD